jgi:hypothetical protein
VQLEIGNPKERAEGPFLQKRKERTLVNVLILKKNERPFSHTFLHRSYKKEKEER